MNKLIERQEALAKVENAFINTLIYFAFAEKGKISSIISRNIECFGLDKQNQKTPPYLHL